VYAFNGQAWCENAFLPDPPATQSPIPTPPIQPKLSFNVLIVLTGSTPPSPSVVDGICGAIASAFSPPLIVGVDISCSLEGSTKRRNSQATYTVLAQIQAGPTVETQTNNAAFAASVQSAVGAAASNFSVSVQIDPAVGVPQSSLPTAASPLMQRFRKSTHPLAMQFPYEPY
jgi:hypothetical protein